MTVMTDQEHREKQPRGFIRFYDSFMSAVVLYPHPRDLPIKDFPRGLPSPDGSPDETHERFFPLS